MDPETKKLLQDTFTLTQENNKMLHTMRRIQKWSSVIRVVYWIVIVLVSYGAYTFIQPYFNKATQFIQTSQTDLNNLKNIGSKFKGL